MRIILGFFILTSCVLSERLTLSADLWPPFNGKPESNAEGILIEIARSALESKGYTVEYKILPWSRAIKEGRTGGVDILVGAAKIDAPDFIFPEVPQAKLINSFFYIGEFDFKDLSSLYGKRLGVIQDYTYGELISGENLDDYISNNKSKRDRIEVIGGESPLDLAVKMLISGRIDLLIEHPYTFREAVLRNKIPESKLRTIHSVTKPQDLFLAISPKRPDAVKLAQLIADKTKELEVSGEMRKLKEKYMLSY